MAETTRHHYVPRFYLRRFSRDDRVKVVRRDQQKEFEATTKDAAVRTHFYTIGLDDGSRSTEIEDFLSKVEGQASTVLRILDNRGSPDAEQREWFSFFLALQLVRGPDIRATRREFTTEVMRMLVENLPRSKAREMFIEEHGHEPTDEELDVHLQTLRGMASLVEADIPQNLDVADMITIARDTVGYIVPRTWRVLEFANVRVLTGDRPVMMCDTNRPWASTGVKNSTTIIFPIDSRHILLLGAPSRNLAEVKFTLGESRLARRINLACAYQAFEWFFHHPAHRPFRTIRLRQAGQRVRRG
jgi:hypothetical protein